MQTLEVKPNTSRLMFDLDIPKDTNKIVYYRYLFNSTEPLVETLIFDKLKDLYTITNRYQVQNFIYEKMNLLEVLKEVHGEINRIFKHNIRELKIEHFCDPEDDYEMLIINIDTSLSIEEDLNLLEQFYDDFWLDKDASIRNFITVTV
ncbi:MAG: hypothetical protein HQK88_08445 [Nitrospirae bacterium]|nr:hypothetical protein [Nitrospirota bacterium]MBF0536094.1 hypothetical protein [Nitrospirota bacterium]MBF0616830.1 hypothetical protein [Nitrospirota bacterium]